MYFGDARPKAFTLPGKTNLDVCCSFEEFDRLIAKMDRRLYLYGPIEPCGSDDSSLIGKSMVSDLVEKIFEFNREDAEAGLGTEKGEREPIRLYINSPGGDLTEGFSLVSAIELSKTPVYTINVGEWCSMAFLIGIAGHKRFSLPNMTFLLHDGSSFAVGSMNKMQDLVDFEKRFSQEVIKQHILDHSNMAGDEYDLLARVELYMLPEDAKRRGFIDEIVVDIDTIL